MVVKSLRQNSRLPRLSWFNVHFSEEASSLGFVLSCGVLQLSATAKKGYPGKCVMALWVSHEDKTER